MLQKLQPLCPLIGLLDFDPSGHIPGSAALTGVLPGILLSGAFRSDSPFLSGRSRKAIRCYLAGYLQPPTGIVRTGADFFTSPASRLKSWFSSMKVDFESRSLSAM